MFDGEWKRCQSDSSEQLAKVLGIMTKSGVANDVMLGMLNNYVAADLTTNIDEGVGEHTLDTHSLTGLKDNGLKINRRWWFSDERPAEEQEVEFDFGKVAHFPMMNGEETVHGTFEQVSPVLIRGNEGGLAVTYQIQDGKLIEILTGNGFNFKQISREKLHTSKIFIP